MDLRQYYKKISDLEATIQEEFPLVVSNETSNGGRAGIVIEVSRRQAAQLIVDGRAALASEEQKLAHFARLDDAKQAVQANELSRRLQVAIISDAELSDRAAKLQKSKEPKGGR